MSAAPIKLTAKPVAGAAGFVGMASRYGQHVCTCGHPAGHLHPEDAITCVQGMARALALGLTSRDNPARFVA